MKIYLLLLSVISPVLLFAQVPQQLYISNDDHTDYMWSANETEYGSVFVKILDF